MVDLSVSACLESHGGTTCYIVNIPECAIGLETIQKVPREALGRIILIPELERDILELVAEKRSLASAFLVIKDLYALAGSLAEYGRVLAHLQADFRARFCLLEPSFLGPDYRTWIDYFGLSYI